MLTSGTRSMNARFADDERKIAMNPAAFAGDNVTIAYGMGITTPKVAETGGRSAAKTRTRSRSPPRTRKRSPRSWPA